MGHQQGYALVHSPAAMNVMISPFTFTRVGKPFSCNPLAVHEDCKCQTVALPVMVFEDDEVDGKRSTGGVCDVVNYVVDR